AILRYDTDGIWEVNFGTNGIAENNHARGCTALGLQSDGRIVSNGLFINDTVMTPEALEFAVLRFTKEGVIDSTFGTNGLRSINIGESDQGLDLWVQPDDKILLTGTSGIDEVIKSSIIRLTADGQLDPSFGDNGIYTFDFGNTLTVCRRLRQQPDGKIIATGRTSNLNSDDPAQLFVLRLLADGQPDPSFGENGAVLLPTDPDTESEGRAIVADLTTITVGGVLFDPVDEDPNYLLAQFYASENVSTSAIPAAISELEAYPNPVVDQFTLTYSLQEPAPVTVELYDMEGTLIQPLLLQKSRESGCHQEVFYLKADLPGGTYLIAVRTENTAQPARYLVLYKI
ncbi:MAG: T9SS type A sorting domain-containing protein, partial [Phaeodactylibacter sp.]|nr:T9SS type A sorting domain-containing protein [Phaeodactylibacter sp.]